jgi:phosphate starvation-inducible PhoH-like protein
MLHFTRYNNIDSNVIERVILGENQDDIKTLINDKILVHGVGGKIIKAMTPNQQLLVDTINKKRYGFAVGPGTGKTYTGVAMAVKALKKNK